MILSLVQGLLEPECGSLISVGSNGWLAWLAENQSFRYVPISADAPFTARKEKSNYWYGYRKVAGKLHKRYIGRTPDLTAKRLEEIGQALNTLPQPRPTKVTDTVTENRIAALEARLQLMDEQVTARDGIIAEASEQIDRLECELASRPTQSETSATVGTDLSKVDAADLLNQLKGKRQKSKADLGDVEAILEILQTLSP